MNCPYQDFRCNQNCSIISKKNGIKPCPKYYAYIDSRDDNIKKDILSTVGIDVVNMEKIEIMLNLQKYFANKFHNTNNMTKEQVDYHVNDYLVCIEDEIGELREYLNGTMEDNYENKFKEVIDVLHFVMDLMICSNYTYKNLKMDINKIDSSDIPIEQKIINYNLNLYNKFKDNYKNLDNNMIIMLLSNRILDESRDVRQSISWKHWKKPNETIDYDVLHKKIFEYYNRLIQLFIGVMYNNEDINFDKIYNTYVTKNCENLLRQKYNY